MKKSPIWFERAENLAIAVAVIVGFVHLPIRDAPPFQWWRTIAKTR